MAHPRMYRDDEPYLDEVRAVFGAGEELRALDERSAVAHARPGGDAPGGDPAGW